MLASRVAMKRPMAIIPMTVHLPAVSPTGRDRNCLLVDAAHAAFRFIHGLCARIRRQSPDVGALKES